MAKHVCPVWIGWWLASPLRKLLQNPDKILKPYIKEGMVVLEPGSAMGFFSLPAAKLVGSTGKVICIDLQKAMLDGLEKRAVRAGLKERIETRQCPDNSLGIEDLKQSIDFAFAIAVVHEVPDTMKFFQDISLVLKPKAKFLFAEPSGHVSQLKFTQSINLACEQEMRVLEQGKNQGGWTALLEKV
jgi:ubiquinone/menaquinone biosynthesis C-methylase UbiE